MKSLKGLIWLFFWLLIFEGALRKWVAPGLSSALLLVRDPVLLLIYVVAIQLALFPVNTHVAFLIPLAGLAFLTAILSGHGDPVIAVFGVRTSFLFIPLIFLIPRCFDREDVWKMGRAILWIAIPMTAILTFQFFSGQGAWINRAVGGLEGGGYTGAAGRFRPPGTFSFTTGVSYFYTLAAGFYVAALIDRKRVSWPLLIGSGLAIAAAIPLSISRSLAVSVAIVMLGSLALAVPGGLQAGALMRGVFVLGFLTVLVQFLPFFGEASHAFGQRWLEATEGAGGIQRAIIERALDQYAGPLDALLDVPVLGEGIGLGTNVGARLATGRMGFLVGEGEWYRVLGEMGGLLGGVYLAVRIALTLALLRVAWTSASRRNPLPFLLFLACGLWVLGGQWAPPTLLGFAALGGGLCLAAAQMPRARPRMRAEMRRESATPRSEPT